MTRPVDYVFLHGGGQAGWVWQETIAALHQQTGGKFARTLTLDVPGCGAKRGADTSNLDVDAVVTDLVADIAAHGSSDAILVGHSQAGTILPRILERRPDLFRRVIYVSTIAPPRGKSNLQLFGAGIRGSNPDEIGWPFDPQTIDPGKRFSLMFCNDMNEAETSAFLAKLGKDSWPAQTMTAADWRYDHLDAIPASYVICLRDAIVPIPWQEAFAARLKVGRKIHIDAGHQVMNTRPQALAEVLRFEAS
jgi:pimeloyl-ACP methyl ester carboxylesterase